MPSILHFTKEERRALVATVIVLLALLGTYPMFVSTLSGGHDCSYHLARIEAIAHGMGESVFPVRLYDTQAFGFGYPSGICYPDLFLYIPAMLVCLGMPLNLAYTTFVFMVGILTASIAVFSFSRVFGSYRTGVSLAVLWTLAPYRLCCIFVRAAVGEYLGLAFVPLVVLGLWNLFLNDRSPEGSGWLPLALGVSGIIYAHVLSVALFGACGVLLFIPLVLARKKRGCTIGLLKAGLVALLLCAAFIVPFLHYYLSHDLNVRHVQNAPYSHAAEPAQLLSSFIDYKGVSLALGEPLSNEMPLGIGWGLLGTVPLAILFLSVPTFGGKSVTSSVRMWVAILLGLSIILMICCTNLFPWEKSAGSGVIGRIVKAMSVIQYPWRLLGMTSLLLVILAGILMHNMDGRLLVAVPVLCAFAIVEAGFGAGSFLSNASRMDTYLHANEGNIGYGEYLPAEVNAGFIQDWQDGASPIAVTDGAIVDSFEHETCQCALVSATNDGDSESTVMLPMFWHEQLESRVVSGSGSVRIERSKGYVDLSLSPGFSGMVEVEFIEPLIWRLAELVSLVAGIALVALIVCKYRHMRLSS